MIYVYMIMLIQKWLMNIYYICAGEDIEVKTALGECLYFERTKSILHQSENISKIIIWISSIWYIYFDIWNIWYKMYYLIYRALEYQIMLITWENV